MKKRVVIAFFATSLTAGVSFAADWPVMGPQLYPSVPSVPLMPVEWTGIYFGVNAGYGWASGFIKYRFWRRIDGRHDDATWPRHDRARCFRPSELKPSARRHCWRSNRFQLASRKGRLWSRA